MPQAQTLRSRNEHGWHPVYVCEAEGERSYLLERPDEQGGCLIVNSARQLLVEITGTDRHWTFDRYFRLGRWSRTAPITTSATLLDLLVVTDTTGPLPGTTGIVTTGGELGECAPCADVDLTVAPVTAIGIDLAARWSEVPKLLFAGFGRMIYACGYDPDEVVQEVYKGLLVRNRGKCPWDPAKSSFGHYVHMVARCVLLNFHRRQQRYQSMESVGILGMGEDGSVTIVDTRDDRARPTNPETMTDTTWEDQVAMRDFAAVMEDHPHRELAITILPLVREGYGRAEIARKLDINKPNLSKALSSLRAQAPHYRSLADCTA